MATLAASMPTAGAIRAGPLPGKLRGRLGRFSPGLDGTVIPPSFAIPVRWQQGVPLTPPTVSGALQAAFVDLTPGAAWFNRVHVLPRGLIDFGSFVTAKSRPYEVFNAHGFVVTLETVTDAAASGVTLPDLPAPPTTLRPFSSFLSPSGTPLAPVALDLEVGPSGPAVFDEEIVFTFDTGETPSLEVAGTRLPIVLTEPDDAVTEHLLSGTDVIPIAGGGEQRIAFRAKPRQGFEVNYMHDADSAARRAWVNLLFGRQTAAVALPLWHESAQLSAAVAAGQITLTLPTTVGIDFRVGGQALVYHSDSVYDVAVILAVSSTHVALTTPLVNSYAKGDYLMPVRVAQMTSGPGGARFPVAIEVFSARFLSLDNDTGALDGDLSDYASYGGRLFLDTPNVMLSNPSPENFRQIITTIDNQTGPPSQISDWDRNKRGSTIGFYPRSRAQILSLRKLLYALNGRMLSFWIPLRIADLKVTQDLVNADDTMTVENDGYTQNVGSRKGRSTFRMTFTDGTDITRTIVSSEAISDAEEVLTIDSAWPAGRTVAEIALVDWLELVRLDTDDVRIIHTNLGMARCEVPVLAVRDDD